MARGRPRKAGKTTGSGKRGMSMGLISSGNKGSTQLLEEFQSTQLSEVESETEGAEKDSKFYDVPIKEGNLQLMVDLHQTEYIATIGSKSSTKCKSSKKKKKKGPSSTAEVKKSKSMEEVLGIVPMQLTESEEDDLIPSQEATVDMVDCMETIGQQDLIREFVEDVRALSAEFKEGKFVVRPPVLEIRSEEFERGKYLVGSGMTNCNSVKPEKEYVKITMEDIVDEIEFWNAAIVCYVLGANPPIHIMEGFVHRVWKDKVDRMGSPGYGIFVVRFHSIDVRDEVIQNGCVFFNSRPVIMKPWNEDLSLQKNDIKTVPIWIHLENPELKYWGDKSLFKIVGQFGKPIRVDAYTKKRNRLSYPRILIKVQLDQSFDEKIRFEDELGNIITVCVVYEWKPSVCRHCKGIGHQTGNCRKKMPQKQQWVVKDVKQKKEPEVDAEGFQQVRKGVTPIDKGKKVIEKNMPIMNSFQVLVEADSLMQDEMWIEEHENEEGGEPYFVNG